MMKCSTIPPLAERLMMALNEDLNEAGDITSRAIFGADDQTDARIVAKQAGVISGIEIARQVFTSLCDFPYFSSENLLVEALRQDGGKVTPGDIVLTVSGRSDLILAGERTALNLMQRMSGVATRTAECVALAGGAFQVVDTRKTTPLWRDLQKAAVLHGGGTNHRIGLYDAYMIKDNHIAAAGGITAALEAVLKHRDKEQREIVVEVTSLEEIREALELLPGNCYLMLDNMGHDLLREAIVLIAGRARIEVSGGIRPEELPAYRDLAIDRISMGYLTHSAPALDLSMKFGPA